MVNNVNNNDNNNTDIIGSHQLVLNETDQIEMIKGRINWYLRENNQFETF